MPSKASNRVLRVTERGATAGQNVYAGDVLRLSHSRASVDPPRVDVWSRVYQLTDEILPGIGLRLECPNISSCDKRPSST